MLSCAIPLVLLASAFVVICCDPELRDAEPVAGKRAGTEKSPGAYLLDALAARA